MRGRVRQAARRIPHFDEMNRVRKLMGVGLRSMSQELAYVPGADLDDELADVKRFIRRAFQALVYNGIEGDYAEFGCWGGRTFTLASGAARLVGHGAHLWAFDSFEGLPGSNDPRDDHKAWLPGAMAMSESAFIATCVGNGVPRETFTTVPGYFEKTLTGDQTALPRRICFAYVDCDLYTSTRQVLTFLSDRLCHGAVLAFDDYYCFGESQPAGERLAASELLAEHDRWRLVPYIQYGWAGMSFMVEDRRQNPTPSIAW